jgi:medium-chain acyl-[acyl-carrier-protein] hydrolase
MAVCRIQLPGRENRLAETPFYHLAPLVQTLAEILEPQLHLPFAIFGHSMGALICFELARQLRRQYGIGPVHLFVAGHRAPHLPDPHPPIHQLPDDALAEELIRLKGAFGEIFQHSELRQLVLPLMRADLSVCETYAYVDESPLGCPISVFSGREDSRVTEAEVAAWQTQTTASFRLRMVPGDHFFLHTAEIFLLQALAQDLASSLSSIGGND